MAPPGPLPPPEPAPDDVRRTADEILARPEFGDDRTLLQRAIDWVFDQVGDVLSTLAGGGRGAIIAWAILVVAAAALVWFGVRLARSLQVGAEVGAEAAPPPDVHRRRPTREWREEASRHAAAGDWRQAIRCRWRALVADLADRGLVDEIPGRTAGEYRLEVSANLPRTASDFDGATTLFERAWYGDRVPTAAEHERFLALEDRVLQGAR